MTSIRRPRRGYTVLELIISTSIGALLMVGLGASLYFVSKTANNASETAVQLNMTERFAMLEREILAARDVRVAGPTLTLTMDPTLGIDGRVVYQWDDPSDSLTRKDSRGTTIVATGLATFQWNTISLSSSSPIVPLWQPLAPEPVYSRTGNSNPMEVSYGSFMAQTFTVPTLSASSEYWQLDSIELRAAPWNTLGLIDIRLLIKNERGDGNAAILGRWLVNESTLTTPLFLNPNHEHPIPGGSRLELQVTPWDSAGDVQVYSSNAADVAFIGSTRTRLIVPAPRQLAAIIQGRRVQRVGEPASTGLRSVGFVATRNAGGVFSGSVAIAAQPFTSGKIWSPNELPISEFTSATAPWQCQGTISRDALERLQFSGRLRTRGLSTLTRQASLTCRLTASPDAPSLLITLPVSDPSQGTCLLRIYWQRDAGATLVSMEAVRGNRRVSLGTQRLLDRETLDLSVQLNLPSSTVVWSASTGETMARELKATDLKSGVASNSETELSLTCNQGSVLIENLQLVVQEL